MTTLLQISDTHFGTERPEAVAALQALTERLRPDLLVLSGDITQRATADQFQAARAFIDRLQVPKVLVIPGNHDIPLYNLAAAAVCAVRAAAAPLRRGHRAGVRVTRSPRHDGEDDSPVSAHRRRGVGAPDRGRGASAGARRCVAVADRGDAPAHRGQPHGGRARSAARPCAMRCVAGLRPVPTSC